MGISFRTLSTIYSDVLEEVQTQAVERVLGLDVELEELVGEDEHAHDHQHYARSQLNRRIVSLEPAERALGPGEGDRREKERARQPQRADAEHHPALAHAAP